MRPQWPVGTLNAIVGQAEEIWKKLQVLGPVKPNTGCEASANERRPAYTDQAG